MEDVRLVRPDRDQHLLQPTHVDALLPAGHEARMMWAAVERLDLSRFHDAIAARGSTAGRSAIDPRLLVALWLYATKEGVGGGRALERLCQHHDAYRWLCGGVTVSYHTLNDFRVAHEAALDELLTQMLTVLVHHDIVTVARVAQDGTRIRASAGRSSFRRRATLERLRDEMRDHVLALKSQLEDPAGGPQRAAREAADRLSRIEKALQTLDEIEPAKAKQKEKPSKHRAARASTTDAEARVMRMSDGGYRPAYNVQFAVDVTSGAIVGLDVCNRGSDVNESRPLRAQVERRTGRRMAEQLVDGGYVNLKEFDAASAQGVTIYAPVPTPKKATVDPHAPRPGDGPGVMAWRARMATSDAKTIYKQRASTVERANADAKQHRGLRAFTVRGLSKARCVTMWFALMYNITQFPTILAG